MSDGKRLSVVIATTTKPLVELPPIVSLLQCSPSLLP